MPQNATTIRLAAEIRLIAVSASGTPNAQGRRIGLEHRRATESSLSDAL
jgi:hypothetical protein